MAEESSTVVDSLEMLVAIVYFVRPAKRFQLCRVNKTMRKVVEASMYDVKKIAVSHTGTCTVMMTTVNPNNGVINSYHDTVAPSSLGFLLHSIGFWIKSLSVTTLFCFTSDGSRLETVRRVLDALTIEGACPSLAELSLTSCRLVYDNAIVLGDLLKYVAAKRQMEANSLTYSNDRNLRVERSSRRSLPFLSSLSLVAPSRCCNVRIVSMRRSRDFRSFDPDTYVKRWISIFEGKSLIFQRSDARFAAADTRSMPRTKGVFFQMFLI